MDKIKELYEELFLNAQGDLNLLGKLIKIALVFIIINILIGLVSKIIDRTLKDKRLTHIYSSNSRAKTLGQILKKVIKYILYFIWVMMSLEMFNVNTTSILATAGIGGLAIGFGAQSLVKDIITGFFILLEDQYSVGDHIKIDSYSGIVEELGLRVTKIRAFNGELHIIPNGNIQTVTNATRGAMRALVEVNISYDENIDKAIKAIDEVCQEIKKTNQNIIEGPSVLGVTNLNEYAITITVVGKTVAMEQWALERQIRKAIMEKFEMEKISIPYPKRIVMGVKNSDS